MPIGLGNVNKFYARKQEKGFFGYLWDIPVHHASKIKKWVKGEEPLSLGGTYVTVTLVPFLMLIAICFGVLR